MAIAAWLLGAMLSIVGSVLSNLGVNTQKYAFMQNEAKALDARKSYKRMPLWWLGLFLVIIGSLGDFAALGMAAQSIVAPIGATTLVFNILFAHFWLKEGLSKKDFVGTFLVIIGSVAAVSFGDHEEKIYTMEILIDYYKSDYYNIISFAILRYSTICLLYSDPGFVVYALLVVVICFVLNILIKKLEPLKKQLDEAIFNYKEARKNGSEDEVLLYYFPFCAIACQKLCV